MPLPRRTPSHYHHDLFLRCPYEEDMSVASCHAIILMFQNEHCDYKCFDFRETPFSSKTELEHDGFWKIPGGVVYVLLCKLFRSVLSTIYACLPNTLGWGLSNLRRSNFPRSTCRRKYGCLEPSIVQRTTTLCEDAPQSYECRASRVTLISRLRVPLLISSHPIWAWVSDAFLSSFLSSVVASNSYIYFDCFFFLSICCFLLTWKILQLLWNHCQVGSSFQRAIWSLKAWGSSHLVLRKAKRNLRAWL